MTVEEARQLLIELIGKDERHPCYDRTIEVKKFAKQVMTGKGQDELIVSVKLRESDELQKQRIRLTNSYTSIVGNQVLSVFKKVRRTDSVKKEFSADNQKRIADINNKLKTFYSKQNYESYLHEELLRANFYDPNSILIFERKDTRGDENEVKDINMYPFEVPCEQVYNFQEKNGCLDWVLVCQKEEVQVKDKKTSSNSYVPEDVQKMADSTKKIELCTFFLYADEFYIKLEEYDKDTIPDNEFERFEISLKNSKKKRTFIYSIYQAGNKQIQAIRVGFTPDPETDSKTFVTPLYPAENVILDLIRDKSYLDITKALHTFLQKYVYAEKCDFEHEEKGECVSGCLGGQEEHKCPQCNGSGHLYHTTDQEVVAINFPEDEKPVPLSTLAHYVTLPHETPVFQREELEREMRLVITAIFNTEIFETPQLAATATASIIEYEKIYDVLLPFAQKYSEVWKLGLNTFCDYLEIEERTVEHQFPLDFKMKRLNELIAEYEAAVKAGVSYEVLWSIECDIIAKQYANDRKMVAGIKSKQFFKPFQDKTSEEIVFILMKRKPTDFDRVLYENFARVFNEIEREQQEDSNPSFSELSYDRQKELVKEKVNELIEGIEYEGVEQIDVL